MKFENVNVEEYENLKKWAKQQNILPDLSDGDFKIFLHSCFYNVPTTKDTIMAYYSLRVKSPNLFTNRDPYSKSIYDISKHVYWFLSPGQTEQGYIVFVAGLREESKPSSFDYTEAVKYVLMGLDLILSEQTELIQGIVVVIDTRYFRFGYLRKVNLDVMKKLIFYLQAALPVRLRKLLIINIPRVFNILFSMVQMLINPALQRNRLMKFETGNTEYLRIIPGQFLPVELGGSYKTISEMHECSFKMLQDRKRWFEDLDKLVEQLASKVAT